MTPAEYAAMLRSNPQLVAVDQMNHDVPATVTIDYGALRQAGDLGAGVEAALERMYHHSEHDEQAALFAWANQERSNHPELAMMFAIPNGGARHPAVAAQLKAEGVSAGVPDVFLAVARGRWHGIFLELKRKPNKPTAAQTAWIDALRRYGYQAIVCYGCAEAQQTIMAYLEQEG